MVQRIDTSRVTFYEVTDEAGQRLDNFLIARLKGVPKSKIYNLIRKGEVRVNKKRADNAQRLESGDLVRIPPVRQALPVDYGSVKSADFQWLEKQVIFESPSWIVLNKPYGLACHGGSGVQLGVIETLRLLRPEEKDLELVHRLDRDTSGCLMIAKKRRFLKEIQVMLANGDTKKQYSLVAGGRWPREKDYANAPLDKDSRQGGQRLVRVSRDGKPSETRFEVVKASATHSWVRAYPLTGRTHQIRVHAAFLGHPIIGDERYGDKEATRFFKQQGFARMYLHAESFAFRFDGQDYHFVAPFDAPFQSMLETFSS